MAEAKSNCEGSRKTAILLLLGRERLGPPAPKFEARVEAMTDVDYMEELV